MELMSEEPVMTETLDAPAPQVVPAKPKGTGCLRVLKQMHREYVTAGGTPIYQ